MHEGVVVVGNRAVVVDCAECSVEDRPLARDHIGEEPDHQLAGFGGPKACAGGVQRVFESVAKFSSARVARLAVFVQRLQRDLGNARIGVGVDAHG